MKFGPVPLDEAAGAVLAHSLTAGGTRLRKGHVIDKEDAARLHEAGVSEVIAARLDSEDLSEDEAAAYLADALPLSNIEARPAATGRVNLHAVQSGLFTVDRNLIDAINAVDPAITVATLAPFAPVAAGAMVATVKIIPFGVSRALVEAAASHSGGGVQLAVHPFEPLRAALVQTELFGLKPSVLDKTVRVTTERFARLGGTLGDERRVEHKAEAVADAIRELLPSSDIAILFGASAVCDEADVLPSAIRMAGGRVERLGMPVDPGNLLVLGEVAGKPVIGAPGCARSPKENGLDWVLARLAAGIGLSSADIAGMGVGGLLGEIPTRPQPRETKKGDTARVGAVVLAAGRSSRMEGGNKLLAHFGGEPLVRIVASQALASKTQTALVVTGHQAERVEAALAGLPLQLAHNPDFASGLAGSLKTAIRALPEEIDGALVLLGDMPGITARDCDRMIEAFRSTGGQAVVRATASGKRGNPVILPRALFAEVLALDGDTGARQIVEQAGAVDVELGEGALTDVDTADALQAAGGTLQG